MMRDYSLLEVKERIKALKEQFLLIFLSAVEGIFTAEKRATTFLSSFFPEKSGFNDFHYFLLFQLV